MSHDKSGLVDGGDYVKEGTIRQGKMVSVYCDYNIYGLLREDYMKQQGKVRGKLY